MKRVRAFLAVDISEEVRQGAISIARRLGHYGPDVRWVEAAHLHLTLKFFGEIDELAAVDISRQTADVVKEFASFDIVVAGVGAFPNLQRPRTVWLGVGSGSGQLVQLQAGLEERLAEVGFPAEARRFQPHLTIGRLRGRGDTEPLAQAILRLQQQTIGVTCVDEVVLYASELGPQGPSYSILATMPLV